jgi:DNA replication and repair protein RecF
MWIKNLQLINFKNHPKTLLSLAKGWTSITGKNGIGKTNILDAIWFIANSRSYFNAIDQQLIMHNTEGFSLNALFIDEENYQLNCKCPLGQRKQFVFNDKPIRKISEFIGTVPIIMITPFDINLVFEGSEARRKFIDSALCKVYPDYLQALDTYKKALDNRNKQLKLFAKKGFKDLLLIEAYDNILQKFAPIIFEYRTTFCNELNTYFEESYQVISGKNEVSTLHLVSHLQEKSMANWLINQIEKDLILERTTKGPHVDDLIFEINKQALKKYASQGQIKSFVIALQLALYQWMNAKTNKKPILLLDDIFEKIDQERANNLMQKIQSLAIEQVIITDTHKERVDEQLHSLGIDVFHVQL